MMTRTLLFGLMVSGMAGSAAAQSTSLPVWYPQVQTLGMVGLTEGQTARLNLLNPGVLSPAATGAICSAQVSFLNGRGDVLKMTTVNVIPGKSVAFDLNRDTDFADADRRVEIRAIIRIPPVTPVASPPQPLPPQPVTCTLIPSLEVFNNDTGRTQVVITDARGVPGPWPVPLAAAP
jgi:hypothetical protein